MERYGWIGRDGINRHAEAPGLSMRGTGNGFTIEDGAAEILRLAELVKKLEAENDRLMTLINKERECYSREIREAHRMAELRCAGIEAQNARIMKLLATREMLTDIRRPKIYVLGGDLSLHEIPNATDLHITLQEAEAKEASGPEEPAASCDSIDRKEP